MGIDYHEGFVFTRHVIQHLNPDQMFENVGRASGMKGVTIAEHESEQRGNKLGGIFCQAFAQGTVRPDQRIDG